MTATEKRAAVVHQTSTRIPTPEGEFVLHLFTDDSGKEHMGLVIGDVQGQDDVLVRVHSECFTGDVLGSLRCDCGPQLTRAMQLINRNGSGIMLYLRQEGRGIGLLDKLRAYNLQDQGYDTVDANLMLGHEADERDYTVAAEMLKHLGVSSVQILTNNPLKISSLQELGVVVTRRIPIQIAPGPDNLAYLNTKASRMSHLLEFTANDNGHKNGHNGHHTGSGTSQLIDAPAIAIASARPSRPAVTISYAQSLDGSIAAQRGEQLRLSGDESMTMTHRLRASHDAILVGIGTALNDDPRLTVRLVKGRNPQPVVIDSTLRLSPGARLFGNGASKPWVIAIDTAATDRQQRLEAAGATVIRVPAGSDGRVDLQEAMAALTRRGITSVMVEGGARIIGGFLSQQLVDQIVLTIAPQLVGGLRVLAEATANGTGGYPRLTNISYQWLGDDIVLWGAPVWDT